MSKDLLLKIFEKARKKQLIDEDFISFLELIFPDKSSDVMETLKRGITKYIYKPSNRVVWTAMGRNQEHLVYPKLFCSCQDYYKNVVVNKIREFCKHIIAQVISEALHNFKETTLNDKEFKELVGDLKLKI
jgi:predicted nucleic acid-binding Zn finger protein